MLDVAALSARQQQTSAPRFDFYVCILLALAAFVVYVRTLAPGVLDGDSGEWQYMANILGVPHSTGYPLYILLAKLVTFVPIGNAAWRVNLFSALCAALTIPIVYLLANRVSRSRVTAVLAALFFALMPTLWASATIAEVYALNTLLVALTLWFAIRFFDQGQPRDAYLMALSFGLALTNHRIAFFLAPALLLVVWLKYRVLDIRKIAPGLLIFLLPLALYLYIPLRASQLLAEQSPQNWELYPRAEAIVNGKVTAYYNHTPAGVLNLVTALDNRNKLGFENADGENQTQARLENAWNLLREQIDPFGIVLAVAGIVILFRRERMLTIVLLAAAGAIAAVSIVLRAESTRFYFSGAYLVMLLFFATAVGWGLNLLWKRAADRKDIPTRGLYYAAIFLFAFFPLTALYFNYAKMDQSGNLKYDAYARSVLNDNLAPNAVLIAPWEVATPIRYFQYVENVRPDVLTIHESPVRPQFRQIYEAARQLKRPFYYAQFTPEDKNTDETRTIQATGIPLAYPPQPQHEMNVQLSETIRLVGYDWMRNGNVARLALYYRAAQPTPIEHFVQVELESPRNETYAQWSRHPVSEYYPTYFWQANEYYRDVFDVVVEEDTPQGDYTANVTWFDIEAATGRRNEGRVKTFQLSGLRIGE